MEGLRFSSLQVPGSTRVIIIESDQHEYNEQERAYLQAQADAEHSMDVDNDNDKKHHHYEVRTAPCRRRDCGWKV